MHKIKAQQFYTDFSLYQQCLVLQKLAEFKDILRLLSDFPVLFKAHLIQARSQNSSTFQACVNPVHVCYKSIYLFPFLWQLWDKAGSILPYLSAIAPHHRLSTWTEVCGLEVKKPSYSSSYVINLFTYFLFSDSCEIRLGPSSHICQPLCHIVGCPLGQRFVD